MPRSTVSQLQRRGRPPEYSDTAALNDIHALLTATCDRDNVVLGDVTAIVTRTGRPMVRARGIEASTSQTEFGWPVVQVDAEGTTITVRQDPAGPGLQIEITTRTPAEPDQVAIVLDGRCLHHAQPPGGHAA